MDIQLCAYSLSMVVCDNQSWHHYKLFLSIKFEGI